jgi:gas vesicle protein
MMSDRNGFGAGFWLGTIVGGVVGGVVGASIASQKNNRFDNGERDTLRERGEKRPLKSNRMRSGDRMEMARRSLDDKISDLNNAIDAVRSTIGTVPGDVVDPLVPPTNNVEPSVESGQNPN